MRVQCLPGLTAFDWLGRRTMAAKDESDKRRHEPYSKYADHNGLAVLVVDDGR